MKRKTMIASVIAAAFALPLTAIAAGTEKHADAATTKSAANANDGGAEAMFKTMDKDADGFISKQEANGTPHAAAFDQLDMNRDGKLSRAEHADAPEHVAGRSGAKSSPTTTSAPATGTSADASVAKKPY